MRIPYLLSCAAVLLGAVAALAQAPNPVPNPSFEQTDGRRPRGWRSETWSGEGAFALASTGHSGSRSVELSSTQGGDLSWTATAPVEPFARYRLSGWIKTAGVQAVNGGRGALFNLHNLQGVATRAVTGSQD